MFCKSGIYLSFLLLTCVTAVVGQQKTCKAKVAELPAVAELRGFRLGMTKDQVKALVPQVKFGHANEFGIAKTSINPDFDPRIDKTNFANVRTISLDFLDGNVSAVWIGFENSFKWKTADEFVRGISQELSLPETWTTKGRTQSLNCADFQLSVSMIGGGPSLRLIDTSADETITQRRQEKEDNPEVAPEPSVVGDLKTKIFYPLDCEALKQVPEKNRVQFASSAEAEKVGYKHVEGCE
jgi:hypothetical protein